MTMFCSPVKQVYKIDTLTDEQASLVEPMSCVVHAVDMLKHSTLAGTEVLILGAGPSGLLLSQVLKLNGTTKVVLASHKGRKMEIAKQIQAADEFFEFERERGGSDVDEKEQWVKLKEQYPLGFDIIVCPEFSLETFTSYLMYFR